MTHSDQLKKPPSGARCWRQGLCVIWTQVCRRRKPGTSEVRRRSMARLASVTDRGLPLGGRVGGVGDGIVLIAASDVPGAAWIRSPAGPGRKHAGSGLVRTLSVPVRDFARLEPWVYGHMTDRQDHKGGDWPDHRRSGAFIKAGETVCKTVGATPLRIVATALIEPPPNLSGADSRVTWSECLGGCDINELKQYPGTATVSVGLGRIRFSRIGFRSTCFDGGRMLGARSK